MATKKPASRPNQNIIPEDDIDDDIAAQAAREADGDNKRGSKGSKGSTGGKKK